MNTLLNQELLTHDSCAQMANLLLENGYKLATAESCTGGLISAACTALAGSSDWFERGFVTYSNEAKVQMLGVDPDLIASYGAVSEQVARAMAFGAVRNSPAQISLAVTGIAGPSGASASKPVGTVWFGFSVVGTLTSEVQHFSGDRARVRRASVAHALRRLTALLAGYGATP